ncbi:MAG TPA: hypothetical protein VH619_03710 [Verrucomicrobiae bacterium]|jgi:hypothetical protein|nr:hypothetical protein [Verrucomicrobiae bacterium]
MKPRIKIGDIVEIRTRKGKAYAQYYHHHSSPPGYGALLRVLPGFFSERPANFHDLAKKRESFSTFFALQAAVNRGLVQIAASTEVPAYAKSFPLFRSGIPNPETGKIEMWWLWDGTNAWRIGGLNEDQLDLPIRGVIGYPLLLDYIETGWTPRRAQEFIDRDRAVKAEQGKFSNKPRTVEEMRHYLIFEREESAKAAQDQIAKLGLQAGVTDLGKSWGVNVLQPDLSDETVETLAKRLEKIALAADGIYDGTEVKLEKGVER